MPSNANLITVRGAVKIDNLPDLACFTSVEELLKALPQFLVLEIPESISNVVISPVQPSDSQRNSAWFRTTNSGGFLGIYMFSGGTWNQIVPVPQGVFWMYGDSDTIPAGYILVDHNNPNFTTAQADQIMALYKSDTGVAPWFYFATTYAGF